MEGTGIIIANCSLKYDQDVTEIIFTTGSKNTFLKSCPLGCLKPLLEPRLTQELKSLL
jgi:hypothetical protein